MTVGSTGNMGNGSNETDGGQPPLAAMPPVPHTIGELAIPWSLLVDLALKRISVEGTSSLTSLSAALKVPVAVAADIFQHLRQQQLIEVRGMVGEDYSFLLTGLGRQLAMDRLQGSQYIGAAPVSLRNYHETVRAQGARIKLNRARLTRALSDLVVGDGLLEQLGPALVSQKSLFLYGPTGNGKTSIAERLLRVYQDAVLIPYAVEVDGQVILVYDPVAHHRVEGTYPGLDPRWVVCKRPCVVVGGELTADMLELRLDDASKIYAAPAQMKANNGILIIDDFGRQVMSPRELLNRWIVPLDRRIDYLSLRYGVKFEIPFELMVVFATNLEPSALADEAFLRRIHTKVYVGAVNADEFDSIFQRVVSERGIECGPEAARQLMDLCFQAGCTELRACFPSDICDILLWIGEYEERPVQIERADLERAVRLYLTSAGKTFESDFERRDHQ
jgi:hypothetical protein